MNDTIKELYLDNFNPSAKHVKYARVQPESLDKTNNLPKLRSK